MALESLEAIFKARNEKLARLRRELGVDGFEEQAARTHSVSEFLKDFADLLRNKVEVSLVGRVRALREHGKITFGHIYDELGGVQFVLRAENLGDKVYQQALELIDVGDFVEFSGTAFQTKTSEPTIDIGAWRMLAKSLRPLPAKWHGLKDIEERVRRRYLDLVMNDSIKRNFDTRFRLIRELREVLGRAGFIEVETPILQQVAGGAAARPFVTHHNALDIDLKLRIAPELFLKRLLIGGFEKVFEIGKVFRNEGIDQSHAPEFTMLELYWAYVDYKKMMDFVEAVLSEVTNVSPWIETPYARITFDAIFLHHVGINWQGADVNALKRQVKRHGIEVEKTADTWALVDELFKKVCVPHVAEPTFVINHPKALSPLSKGIKGDPDRVARFQLVYQGMEIVNGFSELNDPIEQKARFELQALRLKHGAEAHPYDAEFIEALEYGMPPAAGIGIGIDRFIMSLTGAKSLREVILFPTMRPRDKSKVQSPKSKVE